MLKKKCLKRQNLILKNATRMLFIFLFFLPKKQFGLLTDVHKVIQGKFNECFQRKEEKIKKEMAASQIFTSDKRGRWCYLSSFLLFYFCCFLFSVSWLFFFFLYASIISFYSFFLSTICFFFVLLLFLFSFCNVLFKFSTFLQFCFCVFSIFLCCFFLSGSSSSKCYFFSFVFWFSVFLSFCWCILFRLLFGGFC